MLSRTADSVYWMSRYTERAENVARLLDVTYRMSLLPTTGVSGYWGAALSANGLDEAYQKKYGAFSAPNVVRYMVLDEDNPSSIRTCLRSARENAHAVRGAITSESWETLNATWLEMRIAEGRNRQIRRMTALVGYPTLRLIRHAIGDWTIDGLAPGESRSVPVAAAVNRSGPEALLGRTRDPSGVSPSNPIKRK